jgi:hypothetical protein
MFRSALISLVLLATVAGCNRVANSQLNPFNWFGQTTEERVRVAQADPVEADARPLIAEVARLTIERTPGGAILRATGMPPRLGYFDAELVPLNRERPVDGVLEYQFRASAPAEATAAGTPRAREINVARFVSNQTLAEVRSIRVSGAANALITRR